MTKKKNADIKIVRTQLGDVPVPEAPEAPKKAVTKKVKVAEAELQPTKCRICGKTLTRQSSIQAGIGGTCSARLKIIATKEELAEHKASVQVDEVSPGWILLSEAVNKAKEAGISGHRFIHICGGDRAIRPPLFPIFRVVYWRNKRYIDKKCLKHLDDIRLK